MVVLVGGQPLELLRVGGCLESGKAQAYLAQCSPAPLVMVAPLRVCQPLARASACALSAHTHKLAPPHTKTAPLARQAKSTG